MWGGGGAARLGLVGQATARTTSCCSARAEPGTRPASGWSRRSARDSSCRCRSTSRSPSWARRPGRRTCTASSTPERDGTVSYLEEPHPANSAVAAGAEAAVPTPTTGLVYVMDLGCHVPCRDPCLHDHALMTNLRDARRAGRLVAEDTVRWPSSCMSSRPRGMCRGGATSGPRVLLYGW